MFGRHGSQFVEVMNYANMAARDENYDMFTGLQEVIGLESGQFKKNKIIAWELATPVCPNIMKSMLSPAIHEARQWVGGVESTSNGHVIGLASKGRMNVKTSYLIDNVEPNVVRSMEWECGEPQFKLCACAHIISLAEAAGERLLFSKFVDEIWRVETL